MTTTMVDRARAPSCTTCNDTRTVPGWVPHDGSDFPDKRHHLSREEIPCPDCTHAGPK